MYQYADKGKIQSEKLKTSILTINKSHVHTETNMPVQTKSLFSPSLDKLSSKESPNSNYIPRSGPAQITPMPYSPLQMQPMPKQERKEELKQPQPTSIKPNNTGIPLQMKERFENFSGFSFDDVRVRYNSDKPAQLQALAYTQGNNIHFAPGKEWFLAHELGHVVQQKLGMVRPTTTVGGLPVNDDPELERNADRLPHTVDGLKGSGTLSSNSISVQRKVGLEFQVMSGNQDIFPQQTAGEATAPNHGLLLEDNVADGYRITVDMGEYEYIIDPVDETAPANIDTLVARCEAAAKAHKHIITHLRANTAAPKEGYKLYQCTIAGHLRDYHIRESPKQSAHPQATVGIKLDKLSVFLENYKERAKKTKEAMSSPGQARSDYAVTPLYRLKEPPANLNEVYLTSGGSVADKAISQRDLLEKLISERGALGLSEQGKGFANLVASMIRSLRLWKTREKPDGHPTDAKTAMPFMPRTSLYDGFTLLDPGDKRVFRNILNIATLVGIHKTRAEELLKYLVGQDGTIDAKVAHDSRKSLTLRQWLTSLPADTDTMAAGGYTADPLVTSNAGFIGVSELGMTNPNPLAGCTPPQPPPWQTKYGVTRSTDIGYDSPAGHVEGMLLEMRGLDRDVHCDNWGIFARHVAVLTKLSNQ